MSKSAASDSLLPPGSAFASYRAAEFDVDATEVRSRVRSYKQSAGFCNPFDYFERFVAALADLNFARILPLAELRDAPLYGKIGLGLRFDIDTDPFCAVDLARCMHDAGIQASFYVLHTAAYYGHFENQVWNRYPAVIAPLVALQDDFDCEVGLHTDGLLLYQRHGVDGAEAVRQELSWLRRLGLRIRGTAAHNSAPVYGAENFELFQGRAVFDRRYFARNEQVIPLQSLVEAELGLEYEANYADVSVARPGLDVSRYLAWLPSDPVRNEAWMRGQLVDNPYVRWGWDFQIWLVGPDRWIVAGRSPGGPFFEWNAGLGRVLAFLDQVPDGSRGVCLLHPVYVLEPGIGNVTGSRVAA